jgi:protein-disulfide isomerase
MSQLRPPVSNADHVQGRLDAPIVLVEYGDFECPYCGAAHPQLRAVQKAMDAALCFVFRHFPLTQAHPHAERAAEFAEAAGTIGRFWEMHDLLFEHQHALDDLSLATYAAALGCDKPLIAAALRGDFAAKVRGDFTSGVRSGVNGTPCLFANGQRIESGWDAASLLRLFRGA